MPPCAAEWREELTQLSEDVLTPAPNVLLFSVRSSLISYTLEKAQHQ